MPIGIVLILLLTTLLVVACDDEIPSAATAPEAQTRTSQAAAQRSQFADPDDAQITSPRSRRQATAQRRPDQSRQEEGSAQTAATAPVDEEPAEDEPVSTRRVRRVGAPRTPAELTDVPGSIREDTEVRVRPGLAWPVVAQFAEGESVLALDRAGTWFRVSDRGGRTGWVRDHVLDLGDADGLDIRLQPAPAIVAEWRGELFGVMGQSADQTQVALVRWDGEAGEIINAPIGEVTLIDADISLSELPILIGDETVIYRGGDFSPGGGRLLPEANEWMWLPWGWLLAQNDDSIWIWRPETDQLEFASRPVGFAKFSPDGQYLAIVPDLTKRNPDCSAADDIVILPLDGSPRLSLREQLGNAGDAVKLDSVCVFAAEDIRWRMDSRALIVNVSSQWELPRLRHAAVLEITGVAGLFDSVPEELQSCWLGDDGGRGWWFHGDDAVATAVECTNGDGDFEWIRVIFSLNGEFLRLESIPSNAAPAGTESHPLEGAEGFDEIGGDFRLLWSWFGGQAVVIALAEPALWVYDASAHRLRRIKIEPGAITPNAWEALQDVNIPRTVFWQGDSSVAIIHGYDYEETAAFILVDIAAGIAAAFDHGGIRGWPCLLSGGWSPDGEYFQISFATDTDRVDLAGRHWIDGTAIEQRHISQQLITRRNGSAVTALRTNLDYRSWALAHRTEWSPDGEWFAIGGQYRPRLCFFGH